MPPGLDDLRDHASRATMLNAVPDFMPLPWLETLQRVAALPTLDPIGWFIAAVAYANAPAFRKPPAAGGHRARLLLNERAHRQIGGLAADLRCCALISSSPVTKRRPLPIPIGWGQDSQVRRPLAIHRRPRLRTWMSAAPSFTSGSRHVDRPMGVTVTVMLSPTQRSGHRGWTPRPHP